MPTTETETLFECRNCNKKYSLKEAIEKELNLDGCRYYCSKECCIEHYIALGGNPQDLNCPCF
jgi:hypothetical protein